MTDIGIVNTLCSVPLSSWNGTGMWSLGLGVRGQALHRLEQLIDERVPAKLSVGDDVEPRALLHRDHLVDRAVLDLLVSRRRHLPGLELARARTR